MATFTKRVNIRWRVTLDAEPAMRQQIEAHWQSKPGSALERAPLQRGVFKDERSAVEHAAMLRDSLAREGFALAKVRVHKAESSAWQVRIRRTGAADLTKTFARKADAEQWAREREGEIAKRELVDYAAADRCSLGDLLAKFKAKRLGGKGDDDPEVTRVRALSAYRFVDPERAGQRLADIRMSVLQPRDIAAYRDERLRKVKGSTVRKELELLSRVINIARAEWGIHLAQNVASGRLVKRPESQPDDERDRRLEADTLVALSAPARRSTRRKDPAVEVEFDPRHAWMLEIPVTEEQAVLRACRYPHWYTPRKASVTPATLRARARRGAAAPVKARLRVPNRIWSIVSLAIETGMRRGELLKLEWSHVRLDDGYLALPASITKAARPRIVPLTLRARRILATQPRSGPRVYALSANCVKMAWQRARDRISVVNLRFHDLRHEATSRLFEETTLRDLEIGDITGHRDPRSLRRYYNLRAREFVQRFHASFRQAPGGAT